MAALTYTRTMVPRYRIRTWLRGHAPTPLVGLFPKGRKDCGAHEWYRVDGATDRCYHCDVGVRPHEPTPIVPGSPEWEMLAAGVENGSETSARILVDRIHESVEALRLTGTSAASLLRVGDVVGQDELDYIDHIAGVR